MRHRIENDVAVIPPSVSCVYWCGDFVMLSSIISYFFFFNPLVCVCMRDNRAWLKRLYPKHWAGIFKETVSQSIYLFIQNPKFASVLWRNNTKVTGLCWNVVRILILSIVSSILSGHIFIFAHFEPTTEHTTFVLASFDCLHTKHENPKIYKQIQIHLRLSCLSSWPFFPRKL